MVVTAIDVPNPFWVDSPSTLQSLLTDLASAGGESLWTVNPTVYTPIANESA